MASICSAEETSLAKPLRVTLSEEGKLEEAVRHVIVQADIEQWDVIGPLSEQVRMQDEPRNGQSLLVAGNNHQSAVAAR